MGLLNFQFTLVGEVTLPMRDSSHSNGTGEVPGELGQGDRTQRMASN